MISSRRGESQKPIFMALSVSEFLQCLHETLLLGTARTGLPAALEETLYHLGVDPELSPEEKLLQGAAIAVLWEKAGWPLDGPAENPMEGGNKP